MADQSDYLPKLELQLVETSLSKNKTDNPLKITADLITQYRILDARCNEVLQKIYNRRTKNN